MFTFWICTHDGRNTKDHICASSNRRDILIIGVALCIGVSCTLMANSVTLDLKMRGCLNALIVAFRDATSVLILHVVFVLQNKAESNAFRVFLAVVRTYKLGVHIAHSMFFENIRFTLHLFLLRVIQCPCLSCPLDFNMVRNWNDNNNTILSYIGLRITDIS